MRVSKYSLRSVRGSVSWSVRETFKGSVSQSVIETFRKNKKHSEKFRKIASSRLLVLFWNI